VLVIPVLVLFCASYRGTRGGNAAAELLRLFKGLVKGPRVPRGSKTLLLFGAAWVASPIDLIPEFIPFLGPLDDAVVAALILQHLLKVAGRDVIEAHWLGDPLMLDRLLRVVGSTR
jgi:uncharacterized membrane protein YkvA (DUF1232 family)